MLKNQGDEKTTLILQIFMTDRTAALGISVLNLFLSKSTEPKKNHPINTG